MESGVTLRKSMTLNVSYSNKADNPRFFIVNLEKTVSQYAHPSPLTNILTGKKKWPSKLSKLEKTD